MKIGIIGAGFTGLAAAHRLTKQGFDVTVIEAGEVPGGLAVGFKEKGWKWSLEKHYHHWFYSDWAVRRLAEETGQKYIYVPTKTSTYLKSSIYQLDSPLSLLLFKKLSLIDRLRTAFLLAYLKLTPFWKPLESTSAKDFLLKYNGRSAWEILWEPLFEKKFDRFAGSIPASWFWARIKKRSSRLGYPEGGFLKFALRLDALIGERKGKILYQTRVEKISKTDPGFEVLTDKGRFEFDRIICTLPFALFAKITPGLPEDYTKRLLSFNGVGAVNLMLILEKNFLNDGYYWLNINESKFPFLAVVEHTNYMNPRYYGGNHIVYVGNYLPHDHPYYKIEDEELFRIFLPFLKKINPKFEKSWVVGVKKFTAPFAQPVIPLNYSKIMPGMATPMPELILANIQQVYPWDRGTNYAVELGEKAARMVKSS
jgi:protoporphyrinogen oxidase